MSNSKTINTLQVTKINKSKNSKQAFTLLSLMGLSACGGGGAAPKKTTTPPPPPPPDPDFSENPTNTFTAKDNSNDLILAEGNNGADLIVIGKGGDDRITTGPGSDTITGAGGNDTINSGAGSDYIHSGAGADIINSGDGDDYIVVVGLTTANQYTDSAIISPAGSNIDLSRLLTLSDINDHTQSDITSGESIDGGAGTNTLIIYGDVDLTEVTLTNITQLWVNSSATITANQIADLVSVEGDGSSLINIVSDSENGVYSTVDLSSIHMSDIATITSTGNISIQVSNSDQLSNIGEIITSNTLIVTIGAGDGSEVFIALSDVIDRIKGDGRIELIEGATLTLDTLEAVQALDGINIGGEGTIIVSDVITAVPDSLSNMIIDDDVRLVTLNDETIDIALLGGKLIADIDFGESDLPTLYVESIETYEQEESATLLFELSASYYDEVSFDYRGPNNTNEITGTITFSPGETQASITYTWQDNNDYENDNHYWFSFENPNNLNIPLSQGYIRVLDDDTSPVVSISFGSAYESDEGITFTATLSEPSPDTVSFYYETTLDKYDVGRIVFGPGELIKTFTITWDDNHIQGEHTFTPRVSFGQLNNAIFEDGGSSWSRYLTIYDDDGVEADGSPDITNNHATTASLEEGENFTGYFSVLYDEDWIAVELSEGQAYLFESSILGETASYNHIKLYYVDQETGQSSIVDIYDGGRSKIYKVEQSGTYYLGITNVSGDTNINYTATYRAINISEPDGEDDIPNNITSSATHEIGTMNLGSFAYSEDSDWYETTFIRGQLYLFDLGLVDMQSSEDDIPYISLYTEDGRRYYGGDRTSTVTDDGHRYTYIVLDSTQTLFLSASSNGEGLGDYTLSSQVVDMSEPDGSPDVSASIHSDALVSLDMPFIGGVAFPGESDWIAIEVVAGEVYQFDITGAPSGDGTLLLPHFEGIYNDSGQRISDYNFSRLGNSEFQVFWAADTSGTFYLNVGGYYVGSYKVKMSLVTDQEPDGGADYANDTSTRGAIEIGETVSGQLGYEANEYGDWFAVELEAGKIYQFHLAGYDEGKGTKYINEDSSGTFRLYNSDGDGEYVYKTANTITYTPTESGTYFLAVDKGLGTYEISAIEVDTSEPDGKNDTVSGIETTTEAIIDVEHIGRFSHAGDVDTIKVWLEAEQIYQIIADPLGATPSFWLGKIFSASDPSITNNSLSTYDGDPLQVTFKATVTGYYYFSLGINSHADFPANYTVNVSQVYGEEPDGGEDIGDTFLTAYAVTEGESVIAELSYDGDSDWFSIELSAGDVWYFTVAPHGLEPNYSNGFPSIYDAEGTSYSLNYVSYSETTQITRSFIVPKDGTYFIPVVSDYYFEKSEYEFTATLIDQNEPTGISDFGDDIITATAITVDTEIFGSLAYDDDIDVFELTVEAGKTYFITTTNMSGGVYANPFSNDLTIMASDGYKPDGNEGKLYYTSEGIIFQAVTDGSFYIKIQNSGSEVYNLYVQDYAASEPNGSADYTSDHSTSASLSIGETLQGDIGFSTDTDWIKVDLEAGQGYVFEVTGYSLPSAGIRAIFDSEGNPVSYYNSETEEWVNTWGTSVNTGINNQLIFTPVEGGNYFIQIDSQYGTKATGTYSIAMDYMQGEPEPDGSVDILAGLDTQATLDIGSSVVGSVGMFLDQDWYAVNLEAGKVYSITLKGEASGVGTLIDPKIEGLYNSDSVFIPGTRDDDGAGESRESFMLFTPEVSGVYYISTGGWERMYESESQESSLGTYELEIMDVSDSHTGDLPYGPTNAESAPLVTHFNYGTGDDRIDSLFMGTFYTKDDGGVTTTITYSFPLTNDNFSVRPGFGYHESTGRIEAFDDFLPLTHSQMGAFRAILATLSSFINVNFVEIEDSYGSAGTIRAGWSGIDSDFAGWAYTPWEASYAGDVWFLSDVLDETLADNEFQYIAMHELGHAIGLAHPFEMNFPFGTMPYDYDSHQWTIMAYNFHVDYYDSYNVDFLPQTFMYYDILALQFLYGAVDTNTGDDVYTFDGNSRYYLTIWDNGGNDTIEFINQPKGIDISLDGNSWLDVGTTITYTMIDESTETENLTVYLPSEVIIENIIGTEHDDSITGNSVDNSLRGLDGADQLNGLSGNDTLNGGAGADVFIFNSNSGHDTIEDFEDGIDMLDYSGRSLTFDDLTITQVEGSTIITDDEGNTVTLNGISTSDISEDDFIFG